MDGYTGALEDYFEEGGSNKGLEGITWNDKTETFFVLKEGAPGMLLEISVDLESIESYALLNANNGFVDSDVSNSDLDFTGVFYDEDRDLFWIVSHKGQRLFLYDWEDNEVKDSASLRYWKDGEYKHIKQAEGVAVDPSSDRLYVVCDDDERLYIFDIRD